jgi:hypothetical protein
MATPGGSSVPLAQEVRRATERYQDVAAATAAGYAPFLGCVSSPQDGAMGIHYVNGDLVGDGKLDVARPEALMYEQKGNKLELVGVEYIVIASAWDAGKQDATHADGPAVPLRDEPQPLRHPGVLRAPRVGVEGEPARRVHGLEPPGVLRGAPGEPAPSVIRGIDEGRRRGPAPRGQPATT